MNIKPYNNILPTKLVLGCEPLGGTDWGKVNKSEVYKSIRRALDFGINTFDIADVYGLGKAEMELSKVLGKDRKNAFIITKFGIRWEAPVGRNRAFTYRDSSADYMNNALDASLKRLKIDTIPLYFIHWPDSKCNLENTIEALERAKEKGKIVNYGLSNFNIEAIPDHIFKDYSISAYQGCMNIVEAERDLKNFKKAIAHNLTTFGYGPLAQGLLSGKYNQYSNFDQSDRRFRLPHFQNGNWENNRSILDLLQILSKKYNKSISQLAIRWAFDGYKVVDCVIAGAKTPDQVEKNYGSLGFELSINDIQMINMLLN